MQADGGKRERSDNERNQQGWFFCFVFSFFFLFFLTFSHFLPDGNGGGTKRIKLEGKLWCSEGHLIR
jgi:hypothetical protein